MSEPRPFGWFNKIGQRKERQSPPTEEEAGQADYIKGVASKVNEIRVERSRAKVVAILKGVIQELKGIEQETLAEKVAEASRILTEQTTKREDTWKGDYVKSPQPSSFRDIWRTLDPEK